MRLIGRISKSPAARHAYREPEAVTQSGMGPSSVSLRPRGRTVRIFVTNRAQIVGPGHPAYRYLLEMERDFRRHMLAKIRARAARLRQIWEHAFIDVSVLADGRMRQSTLAHIIVDRARIANGMRPRARLAPLALTAGARMPQPAYAGR